MLCSKVFVRTLLVLSIYFRQTLVQDSKETLDKFKSGEHDKLQGNESEVNTKGGITTSKLFHTIDAYSRRFIRSDNITKAVKETAVVKPDARLSPNNTFTQSITKIIDQIHTFFFEKAREDAYQRTEAQDHPYSVSYILYNRKGDELGICSGTLVRTGWVVTAAHCLVDEPVHRVKVFGGVTYNVFRPPRVLPKRSQVRTSYDFFANPRYNPYADDVDYDVALIKINPPFESSEFLSPIPMTSTPWSYNGYAKCILTAFGAVRDERRSPDDYVRKTQLLLAKKPCDCISYFNQYMGSSAVNRYICMKPMQDFGICSGDSGGGLVCDGELKGTVSYSLPIEDLARCKLQGSSGSGECGDIDLFSIFQDLYPSLGWIKKNAFHVNATDVEGASGATGVRRNSISVLCFAIFICFSLYEYEILTLVLDRY